MSPWPAARLQRKPRATSARRGGQFLSVPADLSDLRAIPDIVGRTVERFGRVDILVNNAGIIRRAEALDVTEADWDAVMNVDLKSVFFLAQAAARQMLAQGQGGKIVNIASLLSFQGGIRVAPYTAAKSGLAGLTRLLANEWAARGINVNAIAPGYIATNNTDALQRDETRNRQILERIPRRPLGPPGRHRRRRRFSRILRCRLSARRDPADRRRLAGALRSAAHSRQRAGLVLPRRGMTALTRP